MREGTQIRDAALERAAVDGPVEGGLLHASEESDARVRRSDGAHFARIAAHATTNGAMGARRPAPAAAESTGTTSTWRPARRNGERHRRSAASATT